MPPIGEATDPYAAAYASLTLTVPVRSRAATLRPRAVSLVHTLEFRPYAVALAAATASSSVSKR